MANTYKNAAVSLSSTGATDVYTCPAGVRSIVQSVTLANIDASSRTATVTLYDASAGSSYTLLYNATIPVGTSMNALTAPLVLEPGDIVRVQASAANAIDVTASVMDQDQSTVFPDGSVTAAKLSSNLTATIISTSGARPASPVEGQTIYESDTGYARVWNGSVWEQTSGPDIVTSLPGSPITGDRVIYKHNASGNIGAHLPMQYDGTKWQPVGEAVLCRWSSGSNRMTLTTSSIVQQTGGDYNSLTFTPPWDGWYEISQRSGMIELNTGIGIYIHFGATDGSQYVQLNYCQDFNGYYYHTRFSTPNPMTEYLYASKTYRFYVQLSYPNTAYINTFGNAYVKALAR